MLLNYEDLSPVKKSVEVEIPADLLSNEAKRVTTEFGRSAKIPGFRPGKVPPAVVRNRFAKDIHSGCAVPLCHISRCETDFLVRRSLCSLDRSANCET